MNWLDSRPEPISGRPEIGILYVGKNENDESVYAANCPESPCEWSEISTLFSDLEEQVYAHEDWHENGCPE